MAGKTKDDVGVNNPEYDSKVKNWKLVDNVVNSENVDQYLIELYPTDTSDENKDRNEAYKDRASWFGVAGFTMQGLIGTAFKVAPVSVFPKQLEYMRKNVDGSNVGLNQQMQRTTRNVLKAGRSGLFVTYPDTKGEPVSVADQESLKYVPTIHIIDASRIVNWDSVKIGAETVLSLLVFTDQRVVRTKYAHKVMPTRRELALESSADGSLVYVDRTWLKGTSGEWELLGKPNYPTQGSGAHWNRIPFTFVGAVDNNSEIDKAPMLDICTKNRDHYRNSADNEESVWFCGQAQPWANGLTPEIFKELKAAGLYVGSRNMLGLPEGASFAYAVAPPNTMVRQAMLDKIEDMAMIGARMIKQGTVAKTAAQAVGENAVQHSVLSLTLSNVTDAYAIALGWAAIYQNVTGAISVTPDKKFMETPITAQDIAAFKDLILAGRIPESDEHRFYSNNNIIDPAKPFEDWQEELPDAGDLGAGGE